MSTMTEPPVAGPLVAGLQELRRNWAWLLLWGLCQLVAGGLAVTFSFTATLGTVLAFAVLLLVGGAAHLVGAFSARGWGGFFLQLLAGIVYLVAGVLMIEHPIGAAAGLTLMLAAAFLVGGLFRIVASATQRFPGWGWVLLNGAITLILGVMLWRQWPADSLWVLGLFIGIDLLFSGCSWVALALTARGLPGPADGGLS